MDIVSYLTEIYGYDTPIFIKDIRIGRKSKSAIREEFYRAVKRGDLSRDGPGVYSLAKKKQDFSGSVTFESIIENKYLYATNVMPGLERSFVEGYYSGQTFLNMIGISEQVPAILEITTNRTSSKKRYYYALGRIAIVRKSRVKITSNNYRVLQFLDMFSFLSLEEVKANKEIIVDYVKDNALDKKLLSQYMGLYGIQTMKKIIEGDIINAFIREQ